MIISSFYLQLMARLLTIEMDSAPVIKHIDLWREQTKNEENEIPFRYRLCLSNMTKLHLLHSAIESNQAIASSSFM